MMEHIKQHDWCQSHVDVINFVDERDIDNSVTEKIVRNKFVDPLLSSDEEDGQCVFNWTEIFQKKNNENILHRVYIPGLRPLPPYPHLSALSDYQQYHILKVLAAQFPDVLVAETLPRPSKQDYRLFDDLKLVYEAEQKEYIEWAKNLWTNSHCTRALRPKACVETVYEAEFHLKANAMQSFPKYYEMVAQIPLESSCYQCEMVSQQDLVTVELSELPHLDYSDYKTRRLVITRAPSVPTPCEKHPCRFILPTESSPSVLPLTEIHHELAEFASEHQTSCIASENALKCLVETDRSWTLPLSVCEVIAPDGDKRNILVLGSEFSTLRECAQTRTYRALRHQLYDALIPPKEKAKILQRNLERNKIKNKEKLRSKEEVTLDISSDEEDDGMLIDLGENFEVREIKKEREDNSDEDYHTTEKDVQTNSMAINNAIGIYKCTCKESLFEYPPPRSYRKWQIRGKGSDEQFDIVVHCPHKIKKKGKEVVLEPIPEYQNDIGGSLQNNHKQRSLALSLLLRRNAVLMNVRVDALIGDVVTLEKKSFSDILEMQDNMLPTIASTIHGALQQLQSLLPGRYLLQHEPKHGSNALLYVPRNTGSEQHISLEFDSLQLAQTDESKSLVAPKLCPVLLPYHKSRRILPLAFPTKKYMLPKENKRPSVKHAPPRAIKWPKKKKKSKKNRSSQQ